MHLQTGFIQAESYLNFLLKNKFRLNNTKGYSIYFYSCFNVFFN